jgi:hypothetical protein
MQAMQFYAFTMLADSYNVILVLLYCRLHKLWKYCGFMILVHVRGIPVISYCKLTAITRPANSISTSGLAVTTNGLHVGHTTDFRPQRTFWPKYASLHHQLAREPTEIDYNT